MAEEVVKDTEVVDEELETEDPEGEEGTEDGAAHPDGDTDDGDDGGEADALAQRQEEILARWERASYAFENAANRAAKNPSETNIEAAAKAKSKLDTLMEAEDLDLDPAKAIKTIAGEFQTDRQKQAEFERRVDAVLAAMQQQVSRVSESDYRREFESKHPEVKDQYDAILKAAQDEFDHVPKGEQSPTAWGLIWQNKLNEALVKAAAKGGESGGGGGGEKKPRNTKPVARSGAGPRGSGAGGGERDRSLASVASRFYPDMGKTD